MTLSSVAPAARRMFPQLTSACRVCSWIVGPAGWLVAGSMPAMPERYRVEPALIAWLKSGELGAFRGADDLLAHVVLLASGDAGV